MEILMYKAKSNLLSVLQVNAIFYVHENIKTTYNPVRFKRRFMLIHFCIFLCKSVSSQGLVVKNWEEKDWFNFKKLR